MDRRANARAAHEWPLMSAQIISIFQERQRRAAADLKLVMDRWEQAGQPLSPLEQIVYCMDHAQIQFTDLEEPPLSNTESQRRLEQFFKSWPE